MTNGTNAWLTRDVWKIAGSAFFADLGYQAVLTAFPLLLVLTLHAPVWVYGLAMALAYGPGAAIAWWGGRVGDRHGHRKIAIWGNSFIPLLSLSGLVAAPAAAVGLFAAGWWARNFRTPSRRAMLTERVADRYRNPAFGFLHFLDVGGGMLAGFYVLVGVARHWPYPWLFGLTILPLVVSTLLLVAVPPRPEPAAVPAAPADAEAPRPDHRPLYRGVLVAAALYGFSSYNLGFPILTVAQGVHSPALGVLSYVLFLGVSAVTGLVFGRASQGSVPQLATLGYLGAGVGSLGLAAAYAFSWPFWGFYIPIVVLGFALGVIETLEPVLIARFVPAVQAGGGLGALTGARSVGLFLANVVMGLLYHLTPVDAYIYATAVAGLAAVVLLVSVRAAARRAPPA
ncbi:MAG: MFS transporter [Actinomycetia bacterium]|nr:MFS transporter [Actinomycetes bacterium]